MAANLPDPVAKCVTILKAASNDTEKFAALFMVTKLVKGPMCDSACKKALFEAIGFNFLKRLLLTSDVPTDCPPLVYKSVAMSVLSSFCNEKELASHPEMLNNIPVFFDIVQQADDDDFDDYLIIVSEAYQCLLSIASYEAGQNALFEMGAVSKLSEIYSQQSFQTDEALNILVSLASRFGPAVWQGDSPKPFHGLMNKIALDFETDQDERKFELCSIMYSLLFNCQKQVVAETAGEESWKASIFKGLNDILTSKIGKAQRDPALKLASVIVDVLGVEWCLTDENKPRQFFLLLVQLCSIEVRMQLEDKNFKNIIDNAELVSACFVFLEHAISFIAAEANSDTFELEQKEKQQIYTALKGAFAAVINVLSKLAKDSQSNKNTKMTVEEKVFICAMVRVLAAWLAQETQAMRNAIYQILPFILGFANDTFYAYRARYITEKVRMENKSQAALPDQDPLSQIDVLRLLLPALCHLTVEDQARKILLEVKEDEVLHECLAFHWSIVHYKKPPIPKSERNKVKKEPEKELPAKLLEDMKDSRAAMISICNIFMNITVLEPKMVEESSTFATILKFLFNNLPDLKNIAENLVLHGNMAVFGLLLLKQHSKRVNKNDFSICRYIQATIRFLWDAFNVDESSDNSLVVALSYKEKWMELMELWFLGMQTMSAVLGAIPWISEFAIESGWVQGIVETLNKVKIGGIPSNTKSAYEDFLCNLVEANNSITQVLKENNALAMCRKHRFMELGKKLFGD
ncbi:neurochondrin homolog [Nilaparvata lugens]|uniref:neurochondrin homolog n=1 Tax=Nilaparvata lugens TaxID=108931 RepID=UPI00193D5B8C|nr:neurochondrin homolog [Nilaparvata lugens]